MHCKKIILAGAVGLLLASAVQAQVAVTADIGSTGIGAHLSVPLASKVNGRFGLNYFNYNFNKRANAIDYAIRARLQTADLLLDWYLRENSNFHLSAGLVYNGNQFDGKGKPASNGNYTINGVSYKASDVGTLDGGVEYRKSAPYLGIGWGNALAAGPGWHFTSELGAFYQGKGDAKLVSVGCSASVLVCQALARDVAVEQVKFGDQVQDIPRLYPVLRAAVSYRF